MRYVLEFFIIILPHPKKFRQYFILLIENLRISTLPLHGLHLVGIGFLTWCNLLSL